jgi:Domain of unknown function (DUF4395)
MRACARGTIVQDEHARGAEEQMAITFGTRIPGLTVNGKELRAPVFNEREVRAAAGMTMVIGAIAFCFAYFDKQYVPLQVASTFFFVEFLLRVTLGIRFSPVGLLARAVTASYPPEWVSAAPKRFAWQLGMGMGFAMMIITNVGIRGYLPRTMCAICLTLMWLESVLGLCLGCQLHKFLVRRGWAARNPDIEVCANGVCEL